MDALIEGRLRLEDWHIDDDNTIEQKSSDSKQNTDDSVPKADSNKERTDSDKEKTNEVTGTCDLQVQQKKRLEAIESMCNQISESSKRESNSQLGGPLKYKKTDNSPGCNITQPYQPVSNEYEPDMSQTANDNSIHSREYRFHEYKGYIHSETKIGSASGEKNVEVDDIQIVEEVEKGILPQIVSVEDRAYHMWSERDDVEVIDSMIESPGKGKKRENRESDSPRKKSGEKQGKKTFGKSLLLVAGKGIAKNSEKDSSLPEVSILESDRRVPDPHGSDTTHPISVTSASSAATYCVPSRQNVIPPYHHQNVIPPYSQHSVMPPYHQPPQMGIPYPQPPHSVHGVLPNQSVASTPQHGSYMTLPNTTVPQSRYPHMTQQHPDYNHPRSINPPHNVAPPSFMAPTSNYPGSSGHNSYRHHPGAGHSSYNAASSPVTSGSGDTSSPKTFIPLKPPIPQTPLPHIQSPPSNEEPEERVSMPKVSDCIETWQKVFPWMYYVEEERTFYCSVCEWAASERNEFEVFKLQTPKDVYLVAGQLRYHKETPKHRVIDYKKRMIWLLFNYTYPVLKGHLQEINGLQNLMHTVADLAGGTFPGPAESPQKEYFITYMIKHIAECIEESLVESLNRSPYFSVITVKDKDYAVIRWLNEKGESEEHFFCSEIGCPNEPMSCLAYLRRRGVDLNRMISYSELSNSVQVNVENTVMLQVPVRYPPIRVCLSWLERASFIKDLFQQLDVLTRLCKSMYHKFAQFPEAEILKDLEAPYSYNCVINAKIVNFFFGNIKLLRKIAQDIHKTTGNMEAYGFSVLELQDCDSLIRCSAWLPKLQAIMSSKLLDAESLNAAMNEFRRQIWQKLRELDKKSHEYIVLSLIDIFLSHVMWTLQSPGKGITDIFSKKLKFLSEADIKQILPNVMSDYSGGSSQCLAELQSLASELQNGLDSSLLQLLVQIVSSQELAQQYASLYILYQKITVLPFLHAHKEQCMFNVAAAEIFLSNKIEKRLTLPIIMILLEGPPVDDIKEQVMGSWSHKWKLSRLHKDM